MRLLRSAYPALLCGILACANEGPTAIGDGPDDHKHAVHMSAFVWTFTVTNTNDAGPGSLRRALLDANASVGEDLIEFDIPGAGPHTIQPLSPLPVISDPVTIDGYTQPGASPNTNGPRQGTNAVLKIVLNGDLGDARMTTDASGTVFRGLVLNGAQAHFFIRQGSGSQISGCFVGTDPTGTIRVGIQGRPITTGGIGNMIGGPAPADRNVISGVNGEAVFLLGTDNVLQNNIIGLDASGTVILGNAGGVVVKDFGNIVGGPSFDLGNVITGNGGGPPGSGGQGTGGGVTIQLASGVRVIGNLIGTDVTGTVPFPNSHARGIWTHSAVDTFIGDLAGGGNLVLAGASGDAAILTGFDSARIHIEGNLIGLDITGEHVIGPRVNLGISIGQTGSGNVIRGNTIAGFVNGILIGQGTGNTLQGNRVGTNVSGTVLLGNTGQGVQVATTGNLIGGTAPGDGNVIGGNTRGIALQGPGNTVQGNFIGTDPSGTIGLPNVSGIEVWGGASGSLIGGPDPGAGNLIAFNHGFGVYVDAGQARISRNSILSNGDFGIGLSTNIRNDNPFPHLVSATTGEGVVTIQGMVASSPSSTYTVEFFSNSVPDPSGFGEGERFLGALEVTTDATGAAEFFAVLAADALVGHVASATATGPDGTTSEFSAVVPFTAITPGETVRDVIEAVGDLVANADLATGHSNGLVAVLTQAIAQIEDDNDATAIHQLQAFVQMVDQFVASGKLDPADGQVLIALASVAIQRLGG